jgi:hypothetical protein
MKTKLFLALALALALLCQPAPAALRQLEWEPPIAGEVVTGYRIYQQIGQSFQVIGETPNQPFRLGNLIPGQTYVYAYSKFNEWEESEPSDSVVWTEPPAPLTKPTPPRVALQLSEDAENWQTLFEMTAPEHWNRAFVRATIIQE